MNSEKIFKFNQQEDFTFGNVIYLVSLAKKTGEINKPYVVNALKMIGAFSYNPYVVRKTLSEVLLRLEKVNARQLLSGNVFPIPDPKILQGDIYVGNAVGNNLPVYLSLRNINENIGVWGRAGSGKTNLCTILCLELNKRHIPIRAYDYKAEYRDLLPFIEKGVVLNPSLDKLNLLEPTGEPNAWIQFLADILQQDFNLKPETKFMLLNYMDELYKAYGVYEGKNTYPSLQNLREFLLEAANKTGTPSSKRRKIFTCLELIETLRTSLGEMLDCSNGYTEGLLSDFEFISYEMSNLNSNVQSLLSKIRLKQIHQRYFLGEHRNELKLVNLFEESKMNFAQSLHQSSTSVDFSKQIVTQGRSPGLGSIITDQNKNELADFVLNNLSVQICFNLSSPRERRLTGYSLGCNSERQIEQLRYLKIPYAVISKAGYPPFLFSIPKSPVKKHISNGELMEIVKSRFANLSATPSQCPQRIKINLSYHPDYEIRQAPKPKTLKDYLKDIKSFLEQVKNNLQLNISKLYASLKLSGRKGDKLKGQLLENGLLEEQVLRTGERKRPSKTLKLTAKGERIFSWLKQKVKGA